MDKTKIPEIQTRIFQLSTFLPLIALFAYTVLVVLIWKEGALLVPNQTPRQGKVLPERPLSDIEL